jgi:hypothetical protein
MKLKVEALAECISHYSGYLPGSPLYDARNVGGLKDMGTGELRAFRSLIDSYQALFYDVEVKLSGRSRARLLLTSTLIDLAASYSLPATTATSWSYWLRKALHDEGINAHTPLSYFQDSE